MNATKPKHYRIEILVQNKKIDLGEKYAYAVEANSQIEWICKQPFAIQFDWDAPFELKSKGANSLLMEMKDDAKPLYPYKYMVAVFFENEVITDDPIIIRPPDRG